MRVYLIRHASAITGADDLPDHARYLTREGRQDCRVVARLLRTEGHTFDRVICSPLVRAVQTAELIADGVDFIGQIESSLALSPGSHPRRAGEVIASEGDAVAVVSHAPTISMIGAHLVGQPGFVPFRTCQVCMLEGGAPRWLVRADAAIFQDLHIPS